MGLWLNRIKRGFKRSPEELKHRLVQEAKSLLDRYRVSPTYGVDDGRFVRWFGTETVEDLWLQLSAQPYPCITKSVAPSELDAVIPNEMARILSAAEQALSLEVDLLGSGPETLSRPILWDTDFKVEEDWPMKFFRDIDILNPERGSDVKVPWELSRLQWLIPIGQAYMLTGDEKYADFSREVLSDWIEANPYGRGVNWAVAMEAAMRIYSWTWLFHVFKNSDAWDGYDFRSAFLRTLFEHGIFCERYIEDYGINGNHCTADAGALVFVGLFFGVSKRAIHWQEFGWHKLNQELPRQVPADGADFEGSVAYHRFVAEMFFWPARYRQVCGQDVSNSYQQHLLSMADYTEAYTRPDGLVPLSGDADDGRVLPFGGQSLNDHSYLPDLMRAGGEIFASVAARGEIFWTYGAENSSEKNKTTPTSRCFTDVGSYIMASEQDHVFIDCGPVGYADRGGHGHNDCLSFEAYLDGVSLITDSGTYVYTASYEERNAFRSTAAHNTPVINGEEQNRFVSDAELFQLQNDAIPEIREWISSDVEDIFVGAHSGYQRLAQPVTPVRKIVLEKALHRLVVSDQFEGEGAHAVVIPFHFAPGCEIVEVTQNLWSLKTSEREFHLCTGNSGAWLWRVSSGWISPSYDKKIERSVLEFYSEGQLEKLTIGIYPTEHAPDDPTAWINSFS